MNTTTNKVFDSSELDLLELADLIAKRVIICKKEVLTSEEAARYMGVSRSWLYKLTMKKQIPHYKPMGKMCFFKRVELEEWLQQSKVEVEANDKEEVYKSNLQKYINDRLEKSDEMNDDCLDDDLIFGAIMEKSKLFNIGMLSLINQVGGMQRMYDKINEAQYSGKLMKQRAKYIRRMVADALEFGESWHYKTKQ